MLRVLLVAPLPPPEGGIATWARLVIAESRRIRDVRIDSLDTAVRWRDIANPRLHLRLVGGSVQSARDFVRIAYRASVRKPDVLHLCTSAGFSLVRDCLILLWCRMSGIPAVLHFHFGRLPSLKAAGNWEWRLVRLALNACTRAVVLDDESFKTVQTTAPGKVQVLPNLIDVSAFPAAPPKRRAVGPLKILFIGHVIPAKGLSELVAACGGLAQEEPLELEIVGPCLDAYRDELLVEAKRETGSATWLTFTGALAHSGAMKALAACDVFCLPSYTEGFPNVVMEAMASGKPVVATSVGAMADMLDCGGAEESGLCVAPRNAAVLGDALRRMATDAAGRAKLGDAGFSRSRRLYAAAAVFGHLESLWRDTARRPLHGWDS